MNNIIFWSGIWGHYPDYTRPIGSYQLSHWLRRHKISCQVIEFIQFMSPVELIELTEIAITKDTFALALSTTFWPMNGDIPNNILIAISYLKKKYPKIEIIGGGPRIHRYANIVDRIFSGDSEDALLTYCQEKKYSITFPTLKFNIVNLAFDFF